MLKFSLIEDSWKKILEKEFSEEYFVKLNNFLIKESKEHTIYPPTNSIFAAFNFTPFNKIKVVILGQDPYHGPKQAHGLSFSVKEDTKTPPSLRNIFKELHSDIGTPIPFNGNLEQWAKQGVLLLNATLTVRANKAGSHQKKGWEIFTDRVIKTISENKEKIIFILWGNYARSKEKLIDANKHYILKSVHPSPLSAYNGFFGCKHFSKTNEILKSNNLSEINWEIKDKQRLNF